MILKHTVNLTLIITFKIMMSPNFNIYYINRHVIKENN
jgi:hypothetical protein